MKKCGANCCRVDQAVASEPQRLARHKNQALARIYLSSGTTLLKQGEYERARLLIDKARSLQSLSTRDTSVLVDPAYRRGAAGWLSPLQENEDPGEIIPMAGRRKQGLDQNRIALMIPTLAGGGAERTYLNLAEGFHKAGYQVDLILATRNRRVSLTDPAGIDLVDLKASRMAKTLPGLVRYLQARRPRVLLAGLELTHMMVLMAQDGFGRTHQGHRYRSTASFPRMNTSTCHPARWRDSS